MKGYDKIEVNQQMLLHLPLIEGSGTITHDVAKPHHRPVTLQTAGVGAFTWSSLTSGHPCLEFDGPGAGSGTYLDCPAANTVDLNFLAGDYSVVGWINWIDTTFSEIIVGRYGVDLDGWEIYLTENGGVYYLTQRHHHASTAPAPIRSAGNSTGWTPGSWYLFSCTRSGHYPKHYRNGVALTMSFDAGGVQDPDTCARDLVVGTRFTKDMNWYDSYMSHLRIFGEELSASDIKFIYETERYWYGA